MAYLTRCPWSVCLCPKRIDAPERLAGTRITVLVACPRCAIRYWASAGSIAIEADPFSWPVDIN